MWRLREHVDRGNQVSRVTSLHQDLHVPYQRCRVAGDVDNLLWTSLNCGIDKFLGQAFSRRVDKNHIRLQAFSCPLWHQFFRLADIVLGIVDLVEPGVVLGVLNCCLNHFNPADFLNVLGCGQTDRPDPGVGINNQIVLSQTCLVNSQLVQTRRLQRINLEEGLRRDFKSQIANLVIMYLFPHKW